jgi:hypothetical protein
MINQKSIETPGSEKPWWKFWYLGSFQIIVKIKDLKGLFNNISAIRTSPFKVHSKNHFFREIIYNAL